MFLTNHSDQKIMPIMSVPDYAHILMSQSRGVSTRKYNLRVCKIFRRSMGRVSDLAGSCITSATTFALTSSTIKDLSAENRPEATADFDRPRLLEIFVFQNPARPVGD